MNNDQHKAQPFAYWLEDVVSRLKLAGYDEEITSRDQDWFHDLWIKTRPSPTDAAMLFVQ